MSGASHAARAAVGSGRRAGRARAGTRGFTLLEIVIALVVLEIAVLGAVGLVVLASATLSRAERLERASARVEAVLDSLARDASPTDGSGRWEAGEIRWHVGPGGEALVVATGPAGDTLLALASLLAPAGVGP